MKLVIISGMSGAGKSSAMHTLEDLGFYCVDNLPLSLLAAFAAEMRGSADNLTDTVAVAIDARNAGKAFQKFSATMAQIEAQGVDCEVVYLQADDRVLIKRFNETRRKHPLTGEDIALGEAIELERALLAPVRERADVHIDTSQTQFHQLRELIRNRIGRRPVRELSIMFQSFGFKYGVPAEADFVFDARCLPNPHWQPELKALDGRAPSVQSFLREQPLVGNMLADLSRYLTTWIPYFRADNRAYLTIAIGCTGGHHRSVYIAERLGEQFSTTNADVIVRHRELRDEPNPSQQPAEGWTAV